MSDLTLEEKTNYAAQRATLLEAEKHFYDLGLPKRRLGFSVSHRNPGHWDISADEVPGKASAWLVAHPEGRTSAKDGDRERAFRIRGEFGEVYVHDERWNPHKPFPREAILFRSVEQAMLWIASELMFESRP